MEIVFLERKRTGTSNIALCGCLKVHGPAICFVEVSP